MEKLEGGERGGSGECVDMNGMEVVRMEWWVGMSEK